MNSEAKPLLKIPNYDRYDKTIEISGADFTVWVDNDDVPEGALVFATELAQAWNERDSLRAQRDALVEALEKQAESWESLLVEGMAPTVKLFAATCAKTCRAALLRAKEQR